MKRVIAVVMSVFLLAGCTESKSVGIIGGADGPTAIFVGGEDGDTVKKPLRMIKVDGKLYYDSGKISESTPRCGTLDGKLKQTVAEHEIPRKNNECNFSGAEGYQNATSITKEVPINDEWVIFKLFDDSELDMEVFDYCFYLRGKAPNAEKEHEIVVLTEDINYDFEDHNKRLGSYIEPDEEKYRTTFRTYGDIDKWGVTLTADKVSPIGLILKIEQFGGTPAGKLEMGCEYTLETIKNDEWQPVKTKDGNPPVWGLIGYSIKKNDITEFKIDWSQIYGTLPSGFYRLKKEITDYRAAGDYDKEMYELYFNIE